MPHPDAYRAALERAIVAERPGRGTIAVTGRDRVTLLHNLLTNDVAGLAPGRGCYSAYLTPQGRMLADMRVTIDAERVLLDVEPDVKDDLLQRLDLSIFAEDVQVADLTRSIAVVRVAGPEAAAVTASTLRRLTGGSPVEAAGLADFREYDNRAWAFDRGVIVIVRDDSLGVMGFDVLIDREHGAGFTRACVEAGAVPAGEDTLEILRVEAGRPRFGADMDRETIPLEAGIEPRAISFTKGCYPGQEVIIRVLHRGHGRVARRLVGLRIAADAVPAAGDVVFVGPTAVGKVTSAVRSPAVGAPIALAYVQRDVGDPGTALTIAHAAERLPAEVSALPFRP